MDPRQALLDRVPRHLAEQLQSVMRETVLPVGALRTEVTRYRVAIQRASEGDVWPELDAELGLACGAACLALLDAIPEPSPDQLVWLHLACRYYVLSDDDEHDWDSLVGFDDDALVINGAARLLEVPNAVIPLAPRSRRF